MLFVLLEMGVCPCFSLPASTYLDILHEAEAESGAHLVTITEVAGSFRLRFIWSPWK
jgi:hypothetical protein